MGNNFSSWDRLDRVRGCPLARLRNLHPWRIAAALDMMLRVLMQLQPVLSWKLARVWAGWPPCLQHQRSRPAQRVAWFWLILRERPGSWTGLNQSIMKPAWSHLCCCCKLNLISGTFFFYFFFKYVQIYGCTVGIVLVFLLAFALCA